MRFIGMSGTLPNLDEQIDMGVFDAFQIPYSALERDHEDADRAGVGGRRRASSSAAAWRAARPSDGSGRRYYMCRRDTLQSRWDEAKLDDLLRRHDAHGVHPALHAHAPRPGHHDRRHRRTSTTSQDNIDAA